MNEPALLNQMSNEPESQKLTETGIIRADEPKTVTSTVEQTPVKNCNIEEKEVKETPVDVLEAIPYDEESEISVKKNE